MTTATIGTNATNDKDIATNSKDSAADGGNSTDNLTAGNNNGTSQTKDCFSCGVPCNHTNASPHGALCNSCFHHWRYSIHYSIHLH